MAYMVQARRSTTICRQIYLQICKGIPYKKYETSLQTKFIDHDILEDIFDPDGLWDHRYDLGTFRQGKNGRWGFAAFDKLTSGDELIASAANPPWSWDDHNDPSLIGEIATDPARFITRYAQGWGPVSSQYTHNGYLNV